MSVLYSGKARISPFEGMLVLIPISILQSIFFGAALLTTGIISIILWVLFGLVTLFEIGSFYFRLASRWRRLHYPIMCRHAAMAGEESATAEIEGREFDENKVVQKLYKSIFPNLSDEEMQEGIEVVDEKMQQFSDRELLEKQFRKSNPDIEPKKLEEVLDRIAKALNDPNEKGFLKIRWFIAELVERDYGKDERTKYLRSVILGQAD